MKKYNNIVYRKFGAGVTKFAGERVFFYLKGMNELTENVLISVRIGKIA